MKKSIFTEEQLARIVKEIEAGPKVAETCRKHGISEPTYYVWKSKYAGMEVSQLRHLKDVEGEPPRMKRMFAELALEYHALKDRREKIEPGSATGSESGDANHARAECPAGRPGVAAVSLRNRVRFISPTPRRNFS